MTGRVLLVGAGPGDPELLTLRAVRALGTADLVLCDRLVPDGIQHHAPDARWVDVGKRPGHASPSQASINARLVEAARAGQVVVRLKGGDPLVFGRAQEELAACQRAQIPVEVVPGITAALASAAAAQRPLTTRERDPWTVLVSGHDASGKPGPEVPWDRLATLGGTLAVYMCVAGLERVVDTLLSAGRDLDTPVELVQHAGLPDERVLEGTLGEITVQAEQQDVAPPALLLVHQGPPLASETVLTIPPELAHR